MTVQSMVRRPALAASWAQVAVEVLAALWPVPAVLWADRAGLALAAAALALAALLSAGMAG
jgi:hypothetical protein